jgi:hypothetical protein
MSKSVVIIIIIMNSRKHMWDAEESVQISRFFIFELSSIHHQILVQENL